jgi:putative acetyltransferase
MTIRVRRMRREDARRFLEVHHVAVRGLAAKDYPWAVIRDWAPLPITDTAIERFLANADKEIRLVAEMEGEIVGIGALVLDPAELRACYVLPSATRQGVGSAIVRAVERIARKQRVASLHLVASVNSEPFYAALGYKVRKRGEHVLQSGRRMACVRMWKVFDS